MKISKTVTGQQGSIMTVVLLMLVLITCVVVYGVMSSRTDVKIVNNERMRKMTFYAAEAGIEAGRAMLDTLRKADAFNWDNLLANNTLADLGAGRQLIGQDNGVYTINQAIDAANPKGRQVGPVSYSLRVTDNNDYDGDSRHDSDDIVILTSTATWNNTTATVQAAVAFDGKDNSDTKSGITEEDTGNTGS